MQNHIYSYATTISLKLRGPTRVGAVMMMGPIDTSYKTIWTANHDTPEKAYLE